jgi:hypothetical protein
MSVRSPKGGEHLQTMEERCRESIFDPEDMTPEEHLQELCMVAEYLYQTLQYYVSRGLLTTRNDPPRSE